jgi:hypothetical protein
MEMRKLYRSLAPAVEETNSLVSEHMAARLARTDCIRECFAASNRQLAKDSPRQSLVTGTCAGAGAIFALGETLTDELVGVVIGQRHQALWGFSDMMALLVTGHVSLTRAYLSGHVSLFNASVSY